MNSGISRVQGERQARRTGDDRPDQERCHQGKRDHGEEAFQRAEAVLRLEHARAVRAEAHEHGLAEGQLAAIAELQHHPDGHDGVADPGRHGQA
jgi:hypothetical protein